MKANKLFSKLTALALSIALVLTMSPVVVSAETEGCIHEHNTECGYAEGTACSHTQYDEACGCIEAAICCHVCNESCGGLIDSGKMPGESEDTVIIAAFEQLTDEVAWRNYTVNTITEAELDLPAALNGTDADDNSITIEGVTWKSYPEFDPAVVKGYVFSAALPEGYELADGVTAPDIRVFILPEGGLTPNPTSSAVSLVQQLNGWTGGGQGQLIATQNGNVVTVTGTVTGALNQLALVIDSGITVRWEANYTEQGSNLYTISLSGAGEFKVVSGSIKRDASSMSTIYTNGCKLTISGGAVENTGATGTINASNGSVVTVTGGMVSNTGSGVAIYAIDNSVVAVTGGTVSSQASDAFRAGYGVVAGAVAGYMSSAKTKGTDNVTGDAGLIVQVAAGTTLHSGDMNSQTGFTLTANGTPNATAKWINNGNRADILVTFADTSTLTIPMGLEISGLTPEIAPQTIDITVPVVGGTPQTTMAGGTGYTGTNISWKTTGGAHTGTFAGSTVYTATVTLTAGSGWQWPTSPAAEYIRVVGSTSVVSYNVSGDVLTFDVTFPQTAAAITDLGAQTVAIEAPVAGQRPQTTLIILDDSGYIFTSISWYNVTDSGTHSNFNNFAGGKVYKATVTLTSTSGYKWSSSPSVITVAGSTTVDGYSVAGGDVSGNKLSFDVTFPATVNGLYVNDPSKSNPLTNVIDIASAINGASSPITVTGYLSVTEPLSLTIPASKTVDWQADYSGTSAYVTTAPGFINLSGSGTFTVSTGGLIDCQGENNYGAIYGTYPNSPSVVVDGGTVKSVRNAISFGGSNVSVTIISGTVSTSGTGMSAIYADGASAIVTVEGGTVEATIATGRAINAHYSNANINILGGTVRVNNTQSRAVSVEGSNANITITGGTVSASGSSSYGIYDAGTNTTMSITGGTVTATSTSTAVQIASTGTLYYGGGTVADSSFKSASSGTGYFTGGNQAKFGTGFTLNDNLYKLDAVPALTNDTAGGGAYTYQSGSQNAHQGSVVASLPTGFMATSITPNCEAATVTGTPDTANSTYTFSGSYDTGEYGLTLTIAGKLANDRIDVPAFTTESFGVNVEGGTANTPPTATAVSANATAPVVGTTLTGSYTYNAGTGTGAGAEGTSTYQWYRSPAATWGDTTPEAINDATSTSYTPTGADVGKYLYFEVTPSNGALTGTLVQSAASGQVGIIVSLSVVQNGTSGTATIDGSAGPVKVVSTTSPTITATLNNAASVAWTVSSGGGSFTNTAAASPGYSLPTMTASVTAPITITATFTAAVPLTGNISISLDRSTGVLTGSCSGGNGSGTPTWAWSGTGVTDSETNTLAQTAYTLGQTITLTYSTSDQTGSVTATITVYKTEVSLSGNSGSDALTVDPATLYGKAGDSVTLNYTLANTGTTSNGLTYSLSGTGGTAPAAITTAGTDSSTYIIAASNAVSGVVTITGAFSHVSPAATYTTTIIIPQVNGTAPANTVSNPAAVTQGATVNLPNVTANTGFVFKQWTVTAGDVTITNPTSATTAYFIMGTTNVTINAVFEAASLTFANQTLASGTYNTAYSANVTAPTGGSGTYSYSSSELSTNIPGLSMTTAGVISGTPTAAVSAQTFTVTVADTITGATANAAYTLTIDKANQTLTAANISKVVGDGNIELSGCATSSAGTGNGGAISYAVTTAGAGASISGTTLSYTSAGTATITATAAGDANYNSTATTFTLTVTLPSLGGMATISGTNEIGQTLTAETGSITGASGNWHYTWFAGTDAAANAEDQSTLVIDRADAGKVITCVITSTDASGSITAQLDSGSTVPYNIVITNVGNVSGDTTVTLSASTGREGNVITLNYVLGNDSGKLTNTLTFTGGTGLTGVISAGSGTSQTYTVTPSDAVNGVITITATFLHTDLQPRMLSFSDAGPVTKVFNSGSFTNAAVPSAGSGTVTYTSSVPSVATVDSSGTVTLLNAGQTTITAGIASDTTYAGATASYTLTITKANQTLTASNIIKTVGDGDIDLSSHTISSASPYGGTITYTVTTAGAGADISGTILSYTSTGTAVITATAEGDTNYNNAAVTFTLTVTLPPLGGTATISGTNEIGQTLTAATSSITGASGNWHYVWFASSEAAVNAADQDTIVIGGADAGKVITCVITSTDADGSITAIFDSGDTVPYNMAIINTGNILGDTPVTLSASTGREGNAITLSYVLGNGSGKPTNTLTFTGGTGLTSVMGTGAGTSQTYTVTPGDAVNGVITITATFLHTGLQPRILSFSDTGSVTKVFNSGSFTNAAVPSAGSGTVTYTSSVPSVATVDSSGIVTIRSAGQTTITARIASDIVYAGATASYTLTVTKATQTAPSGISKTDETTTGANNGTMTGVTTAMEYRRSTDAIYTSVPDTIIMGLSPGTYYIRYAATTNYNPGPDTVITIAAYTTPVTETPSSEGKTGIVENNHYGTAPEAPKFWDAVNTDIVKKITTAQGSNHNIVTGRNIVVPTFILETLQDSSITLAMHTGMGVTFSITGSDIPDRTDTKTAVNLTVRQGELTAPETLIREKTKNTIRSIEIPMESHESFGMTINVHFSLGAENANNYANLYRYNEQTGAFEYLGSYQINEDGQAMFGITGGADFLLTVTAEKPEEVIMPMSGETYIVKPGDTLSGTAVKYGMSVAQIMALNPEIKNSSRIRPGQKIRVR